MDRGEFRQPQHTAIPYIGLGARSAGAARAGQRLHLLGRSLFPLLIGAGDRRNGFQIDQTRNGVRGVAANDLALAIQKAHRALSAGIIGKCQILKFIEAIAIGSFEKPASPTVGAASAKTPGNAARMFPGWPDL